MAYFCTSHLLILQNIYPGSGKRDHPYRYIHIFDCQSLSDTFIIPDNQFRQPGYTEFHEIYAVILKTFHLFQQKEFNMATGSGTTMKIIGIVLVVLGIGLLVWGYQLSGSVGSQITQAVTGSDTDKVMTFYISGAVSFFVGIFLLTKN
jgi:hypothetical protein